MADEQREGKEGDAVRRDRILAAACRLFHHYGARKTTVADIAEEAGVGTGSVYLDFPSKAAILHALSEQALESVLHAMDGAIAGDRPAAQRLAAAMTARYRAFVDVARQGAHAEELLHCTAGPIRKTWAAFERAQHHLLAQVIAEDDGDLVSRCGKIDDVDLAATSLLAAYAKFAPPLVDTQDVDGNLAQLQALHRWVLGV